MKPKKESSKQNESRMVYWICDKADCGSGNFRDLKRGEYLNDDVCDTCQTLIHEPIVEEVENK